MVELMTPNQTNDPGITFEWNGVQKIWIQFRIPLPLPEIYFEYLIYWIYYTRISKKLLNLDGFVWENIWLNSYSMYKHLDNVSKYWLKDENRGIFGKLSRWSHSIF